MSYQPRSGSKTAKAIDFIQLKGCARVSTIAEATGIDRGSIPALLQPAVAAGLLVCCKVEQPGTPPQNEYRPGSGKPSLATKPELKQARTPPRRDELRKPSDHESREQARSPQPEKLPPEAAVGKNTGSASSEISSAEGRADTSQVATPRSEPKGRELGPAAAEASAGGDMQLRITNDGVLDIVLPELGGVSDSIQLNPKRVAILCDFLVNTQGVWNERT